MAITQLSFDNRFIRELPADPRDDNTRRQVSNVCFSRVKPTPVKRPTLVAHAREVAELLGLTDADCQSEQFARVFGGNELLAGMEPFAMCYGGHQFGNWAGQLGDGRAINLGEVVTSGGDHWTLQLKGAGPTPYSRTADGLAVLRSSVREFLCSEAMYHLGVPTTRALSLVVTGEQVMRDMFYDGNARYEPGAVVCRVAPSFIRFGNFQIHAASRDVETLRKLVNFTIEHDFPHLGKPTQETVLEWFREVCQRTASMIVDWMRVGFVHGVMNTDNMSILGLTIDSGPYGWLENYDPGWTPNTTDATGRRYCFGNQPQIAHWNLYQLANALVLLFDETQPLETVLATYPESYNSGWQSMMASKLGLEQFDKATDESLIGELLVILEVLETDMTIFFRGLADVSTGDYHGSEGQELLAPLLPAYYSPDALVGEKREQVVAWVRRYVDRVRKGGVSDVDRQAHMNSVNPKYVLRNYLAQLAIDKAEQGDHSLVAELLDVLRDPYGDQPGNERFAAKRPEWARHRAGCSMLSCSS